MSRKRFATLLIGLGLLGLLPFVPQVWAYVTAQIDLPTGNLANYNVVASTGTNQLIYCSIPSQINIPRKRNDYPANGITRNFFHCVNNYNSPITLRWEIVSGAPPGLTIAGSAAVGPNDAATCRSVTFDTTLDLPNNTTLPITFKGVSDSTLDPNFIVEIQFSGSVRFNNNQPISGGCP